MAVCKIFEDVSYCRGQIFKIKHGFGFIKHGITREENIFFNMRTLVTPPNTRFFNINRYLSVGEIVECVYSSSKGEFAGKYSALRVWKLENIGKGQDKIVPLNNRLLCGTAKIIFRLREIGVLDVREDEEVHKEDDQESTEFVYFNVKSVSFSPEDVEHLACNRYIHFVAVRASEGSENDLSWNAIRIWKSINRVNQVEHNQSNLFYAKVEVESINAVGAVLLHKGSKIALVWTELQLPDNTMEFFEIEKGDLMWCLVSKASTTTVTSTETDQTSTPEHNDHWIVRKILDTFTHESEEDHPLPKFYKNNYSILPTQSTTEVLEQEFLKEFRNDTSSNLQIRRKNLTFNQSQLENGSRYHYQPEAADLLAVANNNNTQSIDQNGFTGLDIAKNGSASPSGSSCICFCHLQGNCKVGRNYEKLDIVNSKGTVASITPYGGKIDCAEEPTALIEFGAHNFYCEGVPIAHTSFQVGTKVHFNAQKVDSHYRAIHVWIGSPSPISY
ncbi:hypothetical protein CHUAL_013090 [Chamberlinius hualienensis]